MKPLFTHPLRLSGRSLWLAFELALGAFYYVVRILFRPRSAGLPERARWLQHCARRILRIFRLTPRAIGPVPADGLLVCNHLSYLDILVLASITPAVFVAKREVKKWPIFGWFASRGGTVFIDRERRSHVGPVTQEIEEVLKRGVLVVLFPEGTSSGGETVLPFKSSLLEPATQSIHPLSIGVVGYELDDGKVSDDICYWRGMTFLPHMINLLTKRQIRASVKFRRIERATNDRKELARQLHADVLKLKEIS